MRKLCGIGGMVLAMMAADATAAMAGTSFTTQCLSSSPACGTAAYDALGESATITFAGDVSGAFSDVAQFSITMQGHTVTVPVPFTSYFLGPDAVNGGVTDLIFTDPTFDGEDISLFGTLGTPPFGDFSFATSPLHDVSFIGEERINGQVQSYFTNSILVPVGVPEAPAVLLLLAGLVGLGATRAPKRRSAS
jgi:hypothetical protein